MKGNNQPGDRSDWHWMNKPVVKAGMRGVHMRIAVESCMSIYHPIRIYAIEQDYTNASTPHSAYQESIQAVSLPPTFVICSPRDGALLVWSIKDDARGSQGIIQLTCFSQSAPLMCPSTPHSCKAIAMTQVSAFHSFHLLHSYPLDAR
jgi:hypothetical protein